MKKQTIILIAVGVIILGTASYFIFSKNKIAEPIVACTQEAKICPDGTTVGRSGPQCEFSACPNFSSTDVFDVPTKTVIDWVNGIQYKYPKVLATKYITAVDLPKITLSSETFKCNGGGLEISTNGQTVEKKIGEAMYCVNLLSEGAAGSTYTTYKYSTIKNEKFVTIEFVIKTVQCDNYDDPKKTECKNERQVFSPDELAKNIVGSIDKISTGQQGRQCYTYHQVATENAPNNVDEIIDLKIKGSIVVGTKKGTLDGVSATYGYQGTLTGSLNKNLMTLIYEYVVEGSAGKEQEEYKVVGSSLFKQWYPLVMKNKILVPDKKGTLKTLTYLPEVCIID